MSGLCVRALLLTLALTASVVPVLPSAARPRSGLVRATQASSTAGAWPMFGHDSAHRGYSSAYGPSSKPDLLWSYPLGVRAGDSQSPVVGPDGSIYVSSEDGFFAINPDGTLKWSKWTDPFETPGTDGAPAVAADGTVYVWKEPFVEVSGDLFALNPEDGSVKWSYEIGDASYGSPTIGPDGTIYMGSGLGIEGRGSGVFALHPDGSLRWFWDSKEPDCGIESTPAVGPDGRVYVYHNCPHLVALDSDGRKLWTRDIGDVWNSPSIGPDGTIYIGNSDNFFYAFNRDGTRKWRVPVKYFMYLSSASISPDGSTIYRGDSGGVFYAFSSIGVTRWKYRAEDGISTVPVLTANGVVLFTDFSHLTALRSSDGAFLWKKDIGEKDTGLGGASSPALGADGTVYVLGGDASGDAVLLAFSCGLDTDRDGWGDDCRDVSAPPRPIYKRSISLRMRRHVVAKGRVTSDDPSGICVTRRVKIERKGFLRWYKVAAATPSGDGSFRARIRDRPGRYRAKVRRYTSEKVVCLEATSNITRHRH